VVTKSNPNQQQKIQMIFSNGRIALLAARSVLGVQRRRAGSKTIRYGIDELTLSDSDDESDRSDSDDGGHYATLACHVHGDSQMSELGALLATLNGVPGQGDVILCYGGVGMGKTTLARGLFRQLCGDDDMVVSSPTYLYDNVYDILRMGGNDAPDDLVRCHHVDLYRLGEREHDGDEVASGNAVGDFQQLKLDKAFERDLALVEWAEYLPDAMVPADRLEVHIEPTGLLSARHVALHAYGRRWVRRLDDIEVGPASSGGDEQEQEQEQEEQVEEVIGERSRV
jgi:tRNA threonylcarbamoyladenosine biosynthesis protein TsaE